MGCADNNDPVKKYEPETFGQQAPEPARSEPPTQSDTCTCGHIYGDHTGVAGGGGCSKCRPCEFFLNAGSRPSAPAPKELTKLLRYSNNPLLKLVKDFLKVISEIYVMDELFPSLTLSYLADQGVYYASVCRYEKARGIVMLNAQHETLEGCLDELIKQWRAGNKQSIKFFSEKLNHPKGRLKGKHD